MKTITIAVPDEEMKSLEEFLYQSNITVIDEKEDDVEFAIIEIETTEIDDEPEEMINMEALERELDDEIRKLHHFGE